MFRPDSVLSAKYSRLVMAIGCAAFFLGPTGATPSQGQTGKVDVLHNFNGSDGSSPTEGPIKASDGNFYGPVHDGGSGDNGTIYKLTPSGQFSVLHTFQSREEGTSPKAIIQGKDGNLYGITRGGGTNPVTVAGGGTFFRLGLDGTFTKLFDFDTGVAQQPLFPSAIVQGNDGNFYGLSRDGGTVNGGTYFRLSADGKTLTLLYSFFGNNSGPGRTPEAQLLVGTDGNFYGLTTTSGGNGTTGGSGAIFMATPAGSVTRVRAFVDSRGPTGGRYPLIQGSDGNFYGASARGGQHDFGTIYRYGTDGSLTLLHDFEDPGIDGAAPSGALIQGSDGNFYGSTLQGFPADPTSLDFGRGSFFQVTPSGGFATLFKTSPTGSGPANPVGNLVEAGNLVFFGVTGSGGTSADGTVIKLTVTPAPPSAPRLLNISTRMRVLTGDQSLIAGFILTGTDQKNVIIRGLGPSLPVSSGALADPTLELHTPATTLRTNDDWKSTQEAEIRATTIPPSNDLESAIVASIPSKNAGYTAILAGSQSGTGIGLVELYDLAQTTDSKFANISTRGFVDTGDNVMIGGFILGGGTTGISKVIVRAIGPSLPVSGKLADPTLELHDGNGTTLAMNDNWKDTQERAIRDTTIPPSNDLESSIVATLVPGSYTAIVRGNNNTTGVGLVEVYNLQ